MIGHSLVEDSVSVRGSFAALVGCLIDQWCQQLPCWSVLPPKTSGWLWICTTSAASSVTWLGGLLLSSLLGVWRIEILLGVDNSEMWAFCDLLPVKSSSFWSAGISDWGGHFFPCRWNAPDWRFLFRADNRIDEGHNVMRRHDRLWLFNDWSTRSLTHSADFSIRKSKSRDTVEHFKPIEPWYRLLCADFLLVDWGIGGRTCGKFSKRAHTRTARARVIPHFLNTSTSHPIILHGLLIWWALSKYVC